MLNVHGPIPSADGSGIARSSRSASISLSIADSPSSGYAECAILPRAVSSTRSVPFDASASRFSVGSPLIRYLDPARLLVRRLRALAVALLAHHEQQPDVQFPPPAVAPPPRSARR